jgi:hypothetical protein
MGQPNDNLGGVGLPDVGNFADVLVGEKEDRQTVLAPLQHHPWVHFACHGRRANEPFLANFQLHDNERLTLIDVIKARLPNAEFAFLSACHSAAIDARSNPFTSQQLYNFVAFEVKSGRCAMADIDGPDIAEDFYKYMYRESGGVGEFRDSAMALNQATRAMGKRKGTTVDRWCSYWCMSHGRLRQLSGLKVTLLQASI